MTFSVMFGAFFALKTLRVKKRIQKKNNPKETFKSATENGSTPRSKLNLKGGGFAAWHRQGFSTSTQDSRGIRVRGKRG